MLWYKMTQILSDKYPLLLILHLARLSCSCNLVTCVRTHRRKKFEDYTYAYGGAEEPQLATATAMPQAYKEALSTMRQSLKSQDPLHGLNM